MTAATTQSITQTLATLKSHYEQQLAQSEAPASQHSADLLSHTDALLVGLLVQTNGHAAPIATPEPAVKATAPKAEEQPKPKAKASIAKAKPKPAPATKANGRGRTTSKSSAEAAKSTPAKSKTAAPKQPKIISLQSKTQGTKIILPMHSDFDGLSKLHAVLKVMNENTGKVINVDDIIERLFGQLSLADYKAEKGRMKDVMNRGVKGGLWRKAPAPLSFIVGKPETNKAKVSGRMAAAKGRQAKVG